MKEKKIAWKICLEGDFSLEDKLPKISYKFSRSYKKLYCKGEPYCSSS